MWIPPRRAARATMESAGRFPGLRRRAGRGRDQGLGKAERGGGCPQSPARLVFNDRRRAHVDNPVRGRRHPDERRCGLTQKSHFGIL